MAPGALTFDVSASADEPGIFVNDPTPPPLPVQSGAAPNLRELTNSAGRGYSPAGRARGLGEG